MLASGDSSAPRPDALEAELQALLRLAPDAILVVDEQSTILLANPQAEAMFGYDTGGLQQRSLDELVPERARVHHAVAREKFFRERGARPMGVGRELRGVRRNGEEFFVDIALSLVEATGQPVVIAAVRDMTQRRLLEAQFRTVFDHATDGFLLLDGQLHYVLGNPALAQLFRVPAPELVWHRFDSFFPAAGGANSAATRRLFEETLARGDRQFECLLCDSEGDALPVLIALSSVSVSGQKMLFARFHDLSERKRVEARLEQAAALAESAARTKSEFLANMSHEIRTPMNGILGMVHLALCTELSKQQRDYLSKMQSSAAALLGIIDDVLDFSKIEAGRLAIEQVEFDVDRVIEQTVELVATRAAEKGIELLVRRDLRIPRWLLGDPLRLGQVLLNFATNAVKFTERGLITLGIELHERGDREVLLDCFVQDTGQGLTAEQQEQVFLPFTQADASITRQHGGTGLGLAICRSLTELMDGRIACNSRVGEGSRFSLRLPLKVARYEALAESYAARELHGQRVLFVDDIAEVRAEAIGFLAAFGMQVDAADGGLSALQKVQCARALGVPYDLIVIDAEMPAIDGVETVRRLRAGDFGQLPPLLLTTSQAKAQLQSRLTELGVAEVMPKPLTPAALLECARRALGKPERAKHVSLPVALPQELEQLRGLRVLIAEDGEINRQILSELLEQMGLTCDTVSNGRTALDRINQEPYDLVLMDIQMPVLDGLAATRLLRCDPRHREVPVIGVTAHALAGDRELGLEAGMNDYLTKPLDPVLVYATVARWLRPRSLPAGSAAVAEATVILERSHSRGLPPSHATVGSASEVRPEVATRSRSPAPTAPAPTAPDVSRNLGAASDDALEALGLDGLDLRAALARMGGNRRLYLRLLGEFVRFHEGTMAELYAAHASGSAPAVRMVAHRLKGVAGNLGLTEVMMQAAQVERANQEAGQLELALTDLDLVLTPAIELLKLRLPGS